MVRKLLSVKEILVGLSFRTKEKSTSSFYSDFHTFSFEVPVLWFSRGCVYEVDVAAHVEEVFYLR